MIDASKRYGFSQAVPAVVNALKAEPVITAKVKPENIYPLVKTTDFPLPSISVTRINWYGTYAKTSLPFADPQDRLISETLQLQVNVFARTYDDANEIAENVIKTLNGRSLHYVDTDVQTTKLVMASETVMGSDVAVFQETLTFEILV